MTAEEYAAMVESNLTHVQARCTELLEENRELKRQLKTILAEPAREAGEVRGPRNEDRPDSDDGRRCAFGQPMPKWGDCQCRKCWNQRHQNNLRSLQRYYR